MCSIEFRTIGALKECTHRNRRSICSNQWISIACYIIIIFTDVTIVKRAKFLPVNRKQSISIGDKLLTIRRSSGLFVTAVVVVMVVVVGAAFEEAGCWETSVVDAVVLLEESGDDGSAAFVVIVVVIDCSLTPTMTTNLSFANSGYLFGKRRPRAATIIANLPP